MSKRDSREPEAAAHDICYSYSDVHRVKLCVIPLTLLVTRVRTARTWYRFILSVALCAIAPYKS